jgi:hypothetical protein
MPPSILPEPRIRVEPYRLVLIQHKCAYCGDNDTYLYRLWHLFGILHCTTHAGEAKEDGEEYLRTHGILRKWDAMDHPAIGPFLNSMGSSIPVLRASGVLEEWSFPFLDQGPLIRRSASMGWGFHLQGDDAEKFVPLTQFRDPRVFARLSEETRGMLGAVESAFESIY